MLECFGFFQKGEGPFGALPFPVWNGKGLPVLVG